MTKTSQTLIAGFILLLSFTAPVFASQQNLSEGPVADELRGLADAIDNLTRLLNSKSQEQDQSTRLRKLDIAISYLNFRSRRIEMFERELQTTRASRNRLEDVLEQFSREEENLPQMFDGNRESMKRAQEELAMRRQVLKGRISRMEEEIILLENRIMDMQSQIDSVESFVQKNLEF
jgi:chromosome segregation ATPase